MEWIIPFYLLSTRKVDKKKRKKNHLSLFLQYVRWKHISLCIFFYKKVCHENYNIIVVYRNYISNPCVTLVLWQLDNVQPHFNIFCLPHISAWSLHFFHYEFSILFLTVAIPTYTPLLLVPLGINKLIVAYCTLLCFINSTNIFIYVFKLV